jgi:hypothetical protein
MKRLIVWAFIGLACMVAWIVCADGISGGDHAFEAAPGAFRPATPRERQAQAEARAASHDAAWYERAKQAAPRPPTGPSGPRSHPIPEVEEAVREALNSGAIHSVDIDGSTVRMSPGLWLTLTLEQKQQSLLFWSAYFQSHGKPGQVHVLSDRNDTVLGSYSVWTGPKVLL